jgi:5,10-methylenetetrahydromethanopterin reductase
MPVDGLPSSGMDLGVCMAAKVDDIEYAVLAEELGYTHLWVADSQMLWSDCYVTLALAATRTSRMQLGTGVAVAGTRTSAVTAAAHATLNRLAPGRIFCGIGTGNTAMRVMGHRPMPIAEFERFIEELGHLLDGNEADVDWRGRTARVRHLMPDAGFVAFTPRIPLYVSGFGPRAMAVAARHGDGLVMSVPPQAAAVERVWARLRAAGAAVGRALEPDAFLTCTLTTMVVLGEGEAADSDRVKDACGAFAIAGLHYHYEQWKEAGRPDQPARFDFWDDYVATLDAVDPHVLHQRIHQGHNCWVVDDERRFVTRELIESTCMVGTPAQLAARLQDMEQAGLRQVMLLPPLHVKEAVLHDVAEQVMPLLR